MYEEFLPNEYVHVYASILQILDSFFFSIKMNPSHPHPPSIYKNFISKHSPKYICIHADTTIYTLA